MNWVAQENFIFVGESGRAVAVGMAVTPDVTRVGSKAAADRIANERAMLMAAAPELLAVAELILKEWEAPTEGVFKGELIARLCQYTTQARAAINKAKGAV